MSGLVWSDPDQTLEMVMGRGPQAEGKLSRYHILHRTKKFAKHKMTAIRRDFDFVFEIFGFGPFLAPKWAKKWIFGAIKFHTKFHVCTQFALFKKKKKNF